MNIEIHSIQNDEVINSLFLSGITDYKSGIEILYPLIDRLDIQRKTQNEKFYKRLEEDLVKGCIMPAITIALVDERSHTKLSKSDFETLVVENINNGFVLDGIQRLNTLKRIAQNPNLDLSRPLYLNILICKSKDNLLYRMVTLNNGQKSMSARHQIEILAANIYDFKGLPIHIVTEKEAKNKRYIYALKKADVISAYIAYLSNSINLDSSKIIQSKMDDLIAKRILDSDITSDNMEYTDLIEQVARLSDANYEILQWFKNGNNLTGFVVGAKVSFKIISKISQSEFSDIIEIFEESFRGLNVSKIRVATERKKLSAELIKNIDEYRDIDSDDMLIKFTDVL
jgi:RNase H-fold protein (predicted Holliday junction resolvase)